VTEVGGRKAGITAAAISLALGLAACGGSAGSGGSGSFYQAGYTFGQAASGFSGSPEAIVAATSYDQSNSLAICDWVKNLTPQNFAGSAPAGEPVPASEMPPADTGSPAADDWVNGCIKGMGG
jgi:hypothetical protein